MSEIDIDAIRKQSDRYTGATGAGQSFLAHQLVAAVLGLLDKVERQRIELRDAGNDLLDVRGILSPNGFPRRVPADVPMVPTVAPAVEWLANEVDRLTELLAFRDREIAASAEAWDTEFARLRAENERLTDEVERLQESYVASQSAVLYHQTSADLLREHLAAARQGRVWPASATPLPQRNPGQSADEVGEFPVLVQPGPIDVMATLRTEGEKP
jgi:hypothetical protein